MDLQLPPLSLEIDNKEAWVWLSHYHQTQNTALQLRLKQAFIVFAYNRMSIVIALLSHCKSVLWSNWLPGVKCKVDSDSECSSRKGLIKCNQGASMGWLYWDLLYLFSWQVVGPWLCMKGWTFTLLNSGNYLHHKNTDYSVKWFPHCFVLNAALFWIIYMYCTVRKSKTL